MGHSYIGSGPSSPAGPGRARGAGEQPVPEVIRQLADQIQTFIQQELALVRAEMGSKARQAGIGAGMFGGAAFAGMLAALTLTAGLVLLLALVMPAWLAAFVVGVLYAAVAGFLAMSGKAKVKEASPLVPEEAMQSLQDAKEQVQQAWERGTRS
jgi:hypothetical protein